MLEWNDKRGIMYVGRLILNRKRNQIAILVEIFLHISMYGLLVIFLMMEVYLHPFLRVLVVLLLSREASCNLGNSVTTS